MSRPIARLQLPAVGAPALLVGHLMASAPPRSTAENVASTGASLAGHVLLLALAVWLTTGHAPRVLRAGPKVDLFYPAESPAPPAPRPVPDPPALPKTATAAPTAPVRKIDFGIVVAPRIISTEIPIPRPGLPISESLYNGMGTSPGDASGGGGGQVETASGAGVEPRPEDFIPITVKPELQNRTAVMRALQRAYPPILRDAGVAGDVLVWVFVNEEGLVTRTQIRQSSGVPQLDEAALAVATQMRFSPALNRDVRVKVWVSLPIRFRVGD